MECIDVRSLFKSTSTSSPPFSSSRRLKVPSFGGEVGNFDDKGINVLTANCPATDISAVAKGCELILFSTKEEDDEQHHLPLELEFEATITSLCWDQQGV